MRLIKTIMIWISSMSLTVAWASSSLERISDSLYLQMTPLEKLQELVLIQPSGSEIPELIYGGVYLQAPVATTLFDASTHVVLQLDETLLPFKNELQALPQLITLASLRDQQLLEEYLSFYRKTCLRRGIDQVVLPTLMNDDQAQKETLRRMNSFDPSFFISGSDLAFLPLKKKKELQQALSKNDFWVIPQSELGESLQKLEKQSVYLIGNVSDLENRVKENIKTHFGETNDDPVKLPGRLEVSISRKSIIPLQKIPNILPLKSDTICLITDDPGSMFAEMLSKYAYLNTNLADILTSNAPVVIEGYSNIPSGILNSSRKKIFVGPVNLAAMYASELDGALAYTHPSVVYDWLIPQMLFGAADVSGKLAGGNAVLSKMSDAPITGHEALGYAPPGLLGFDGDFQEKINTILNEAVTTGATPGGQLIIALDGVILEEQPFGYLTYDSLIPVDKNTIYDLASVSKVTGTLLAVMKLYEDQKINLDIPIVNYLPSYAGSNKEKITIRSLLSHNAGLKSYLPFWQKLIDTENLGAFYYETADDEKNDRRSYGIKADPAMRDTLNRWIIESPLITRDTLPRYNYSDIGFMILHQIVEAVAGIPMDEYLNLYFYQPLHLTRVTYNPLNHGYDRFEIAPTEQDAYFRDELIWGVVHDRNAAVFGGVAGHAGLFSSAHELAVIMQTLLQGGTYGGVKVLQPETINYFNTRFYPNNRRALGWDKKDEKSGNASSEASPASFGHTGFTGTMVWADPTYDLIFIFLSNRVHPSANNYQLIRNNIRTRLQDVVYEAILAKWIK